MEKVATKIIASLTPDGPRLQYMKARTHSFYLNSKEEKDLKNNL